MIELKITEKILRYKLKWFYKKPQHYDALKFVEYYSTNVKTDIFGFKRGKAFTKVIDLTKTPEELMNQCGKNTIYKIQRAKRDGVRFEIEKNIDAFIEFYNSFAESNNLQKLIKNHFSCLGDNLSITKGVFENETLVMHSYILDKNTKRVRLLNTASLFRYETDSKKRNLIGRVNRFLHYEDMIYFKEQGCEVYDMGGYAHNTKDNICRNINEFKDGFGGTIIEESNYISLPLYIYRSLTIYIKSILNKKQDNSIILIL